MLSYKGAPLATRQRYDATMRRGGSYEQKNPLEAPWLSLISQPE